MDTQNSSTVSISVNSSMGNFVVENGEMLLVSDMDGDGEIPRPLTSWIFTIISSICLIAFLAVSFARYHRRIKLKREKEEEYAEYFKAVCPDDNYFEITRARCVITSTHADTPNDAYLHSVHQQGINEFIPDMTSLHTCADVHLATFDSSSIESEPQHFHDNELPDMRGNLSKLSDHVQMGFESDEENQHEFKSSNKNLKNRETVGSKQASGKRPLFKYNSGNSSRCSNISTIRRKSKSRHFFKRQSVPDIDFNPRIDVYGGAYGFRRQSEPAISNNYPGKIYACDEDSYDVSHLSQELIHQYYLDCNLPIPSNLLRKHISKSEETMRHSNALYDANIIMQPKKKAFQELIHRDAGGNINLNCRTLPQLEAEFHENISEYNASHDTEQFQTSCDTDQYQAQDDIFTLTSKFNEPNSDKVVFNQVEYSLNENTITTGRKRYFEKHKEFRRRRSVPLLNISLPARTSEPHLEPSAIEAMEGQEVNSIQLADGSNMYEDELV